MEKLAQVLDLKPMSYLPPCGIDRSLVRPRPTSSTVIITTAFDCTDCSQVAEEVGSGTEPASAAVKWHTITVEMVVANIDLQLPQDSGHSTAAVPAWQSGTAVEVADTSQAAAGIAIVVTAEGKLLQGTMQALGQFTADSAHHIRHRGSDYSTATVEADTTVSDGWAVATRDNHPRPTDTDQAEERSCPAGHTAAHHTSLAAAVALGLRSTFFKNII